MQRLAVLRVPLLPLGWNLANGRIGAAWHITQNSVEAHSLVLPYGAVFVLQFWELLGHMIDDDYIGSVQSIHLVRKHESSLWIGIIGHYKPFAWFLV
jgi:hypothetical protein